jgi:hypothetical protein
MIIWLASLEAMLQISGSAVFPINRIHIFPIAKHALQSIEGKAG